MHITVQIKDVYGVQKAYPLDRQAQLFASMLGTKTLTDHALRHIEMLGYEIRQETRIIDRSMGRDAVRVLA